MLWEVGFSYDFIHHLPIAFVVEDELALVGLQLHWHELKGENFALLFSDCYVLLITEECRDSVSELCFLFLYIFWFISFLLLFSLFLLLLSVALFG